MFSWLLDHMWATMSVATLIVIACGAIAWFIPPLRRIAIEVGVFVAGLAVVFTRGYLTAKRERAAKDEKMVKRAQEKFDEIDRRPDTSDDLDKRLRDGKF